MRKTAILLAALCLLSALTGCGEKEGRAKGTPTGGSAVAQLMENAEKEERAEPLPAEAASTQPTEEASPPLEPVVLSETEGVDIDLTLLSRTMVFAQVSGLVYEPDEHIGQIVRMRGESVSEYYDKTDTTYHYVIVADAAACCAQGIEYLLTDDGVYPPDGEEVTVTGEFELYEEEGIEYCRLKDAVMETAG